MALSSTLLRRLCQSCISSCASICSSEGRVLGRYSQRPSSVGISGGLVPTQASRAARPSRAGSRACSKLALSASNRPMSTATAALSCCRVQPSSSCSTRAGRSLSCTRCASASAKAGAATGSNHSATFCACTAPMRARPSLPGSIWANCSARCPARRLVCSASARCRWPGCSGSSRCWPRVSINL